MIRRLLPPRGVEGRTQLVLPATTDRPPSAVISLDYTSTAGLYAHMFCVTRVRRRPRCHFMPEGFG